MEIGYAYTPSSSDLNKHICFSGDVIDNTIPTSQIMKTAQEVLVSSSIPLNSNSTFKISTEILNLDTVYCIFTVSPSNIGEYYLDNIRINIQ